MAKPLSAKKIAERDELYARIRAEHADFSAAITAIDPVKGHEWIVQRGWDTWFLGDMRQSVSNTGASIFLRKTGADANDPDQLHVEIRLFWGELQKHPYRPMSAIVWAERGARIWGSPRIDHIEQGSTYRNCDPINSGSLHSVGHRHLYTGDIETMRDLVVEVMTEVMAKDAEGIQIPEPPVYEMALCA